MAIAPATKLLALPDPSRHAGGFEELGCYSQMHSTLAEVLTPSDVAELAQIVAEARDGGRRITLRAGGNAFDSQSLGSDVVISLKRLDAIGDVFHDDGDACITVGAGARWGDILDTVSPLGLVPAIMVTTENATAGGTLSGNCLSRFSPTFGKEGGWVKRFELLTVGRRRASPARRPPTTQRPDDVDARGARLHGGDRRPRLHRRRLRDHVQARARLRPGARAAPRRSRSRRR